MSESAVNPLIPAPPPSFPDAPTFLPPGQIVTQSGGITTGGPTVVSGTHIESVNYTLVVRVPVPFFNINVAALAAGFINAELSKLGIPQAINFVIQKAEAIIANVVADVQSLIENVPNVSILIMVRVGDVNIVNIRIFAEKTPVEVPIPTFSLALPNFDFNFTFVLPFPAPPPVNIAIPVPVPVIHFPAVLLGFSGGNVSVEAAVAAGSQPKGINFTPGLPASNIAPAQGIPVGESQSKSFTIGDPVHFPSI